MAQNLMFPGGAPLPAREAVAGFSPDQIQSQNMVERLGGVPVTNGAQGYINWNPANIPQWGTNQSAGQGAPLPNQPPGTAPPQFPTQFPPGTNPLALAGLLGVGPGMPFGGLTNVGGTGGA